MADGGILEGWPDEVRDALERLAAHRRIDLRPGRGEVEIWAEAADGRQLKLGGAETPAAEGEARLYLSHVFVLNQKLADSAIALGFVAVPGPGGRRIWVVDGEDAVVRFAEGVSALVGLRDGTASRPARPMPRAERLLAPRSVAVLGDPADTSDGAAGAVVAMLEAAGFAGTVHAPGADAATLAEIAPEMVVLAEGAGSAGEAIAAAAEAGAASVVMLGGAPWPAPDEETAGTLPVIVGPASAGLFRVASRFVVTRDAALAAAMTADARTGVVVQSATAARTLAALARARGLGIGALIDAAAKPGLDVAAALRLMVDDQTIDTVLVAVERIGDGVAFVEALQRARAAKKPVVVLAPGRTPSGRAALGLDPEDEGDAVLDAVLAQHGGYRAERLVEAVDVARAAAPGVFASGPAIGLANARGLDAALAADAAEATGLVPVVTEGLRTDGLDGVIRFGATAEAPPPPSLPCLDCAPAPAEGVPAAPRFDDPAEAVAAMAALVRLGALFAAQIARPALPIALPPLPVAADADGRPEPTATRTALAAAGIVTAEERLVRSPEAAEAAVAAAGRASLTPVAPDLPGSVLAGVEATGVTAAEVAARFPDVVARAREAAPGAKLTGMLVTPETPHGPSATLSVRRDPRFGAVIEAGLPRGRTVRRVAPLAPGVAVAMAETLLAPALAYAEAATDDEEARGVSSAAVAALATLIDKVASFAAAHGADLGGLRLAPVHVTPEGAVIGGADLRVATEDERA